MSKQYRAWDGERDESGRMKRITAFTVLAAFAAALLLAMLPAIPARAETEPTVGYIVTFTEGGDIVAVKMYFEATDANHSIDPLLVR